MKLEDIHPHRRFTKPSQTRQANEGQENHATRSDDVTEVQRTLLETPSPPPPPADATHPQDILRVQSLLLSSQKAVRETHYIRHGRRLRSHNDNLKRPLKTPPSERRPPLIWFRIYPLARFLVVNRRLQRVNAADEESVSEKMQKSRLRRIKRRGSDHLHEQFPDVNQRCKIRGGF